MGKQRFRRQHKFWLDVAKEDEESLDNLIEALKAQGEYTSTVRDGLLLVTDLRAGSLDVLLSLFPWVATLLQPGREETPGVYGGTSKREMAYPDDADLIVRKEETGTASVTNFLDSLASFE